MTLQAILFAVTFLAGFMTSKRLFEGRFKRQIASMAALHSAALSKTRNEGVKDGIRTEQLAQAAREKKEALLQ